MNNNAQRVSTGLETAGQQPIAAFYSLLSQFSLAAPTTGLCHPYGFTFS